MAVSNLIEDQATDHVKRVAEFALAAVKEASKIPVDMDDPSKGFVQIRCGFHSGPVVSNVVGCKWSGPFVECSACILAKQPLIFVFTFQL